MKILAVALLLGSVAFADDLSTIQKALPTLKVSLCKIKALSNFKAPKGSRVAMGLRIDEEKYSESCLKATSTDQISFAATQRARSCVELCREDLRLDEGDRSACAKECDQVSVDITTKAMYFSKGLEAALDTDCGRKSPATGKSAKGTSE